MGGGIKSGSCISIHILNIITLSFASTFRRAKLSLIDIKLILTCLIIRDIFNQLYMFLYKEKL